MSQTSISDYFHLPIEKQDYLIFCSHKYRFIFIRNLKVASSTIVKNLYFLETGDYPAKKELIFDRDTTIFPSFSSEAGVQQLVNLLQEKEYFTFTFVRNPYSRLLSAYLFLIKDEQSRKDKPIDIEKEFDLPQYYKMSFLEFLLRVREQSALQMNGHWRPQWFALGIKKGVKYDFIGRFEQVTQDLEKVLQHLAPTKSWQLASHTNHKTNANQLLAEYYGYEEKALVAEIYENDFRYFGYGYELPTS